MVRSSSGCLENHGSGMANQQQHEKQMEVAMSSAFSVALSANKRREAGQARQKER